MAAKLVTQDQVDAQLATANVFKSAGDLDKYRAAYKDYTRLRVRRGSQVNHPVHGPALAALEGREFRGPRAAAPTATGTGQESDKPSLSAWSGQQLQGYLDRPVAVDDSYSPLGMRLRPESSEREKWVGGVHHTHADIMGEVGDSLSRTAWSLSSGTGPNSPRHEAADIADLHNTIDVGFRHLDRHIYHHMRGNATEAAQHLNSARAAFTRVAPKISAMQARLGLPAHVEVASNSLGKGVRAGTKELTNLAASVAADYASKYANSSTKKAEKGTGYSYAIKNQGLPDSLVEPVRKRMTTEEKDARKQYVTKKTESEFGSRGYLSSRPDDEVEVADDRTPDERRQDRQMDLRGNADIRDVSPKSKETSLQLRGAAKTYVATKSLVGPDGHIKPEDEAEVAALTSHVHSILHEMHAEALPTAGRGQVQIKFKDLLDRLPDRVNRRLGPVGLDRAIDAWVPHDRITDPDAEAEDTRSGGEHLHEDDVKSSDAREAYLDEALGRDGSRGVGTPDSYREATPSHVTVDEPEGSATSEAPSSSADDKAFEAAHAHFWSTRKPTHRTQQEYYDSDAYNNPSKYMAANAPATATPKKGARADAFNAGRGGY